MNQKSEILMEEFQTNHLGDFLLQPFIHQVGGHSSMLCLDEATVCKPVVNQELQFYKTIPECLKQFVPIYYGTVKVYPIQDGDYIVLSATKPSNYSPKPSRTLKQLRLRKNGNIEVEGVPVSATFECDQTKSESLAQVNPWVLKCHREYIAKLMDEKGGRSLPLDFIVLENLTWRFSLPCILDLKMGTRQHGDNDSLAKRQSKMVKVISTTTAKLGLRIGGMQVYQASSGKFLCFNKLYGRTLSVAGFHNALRKFLHDGTCLRTDALPPLIRRLEELHNTLTGLDSIRLFTTSLLLLYQGREAINNGDAINGDINEVCNTQETEQEERAGRTSSVDRQSDSLKIQDNFRHRSSSCNPSRKPFRPVERTKEEPLTDVRIIDFAHSTHQAMDDSVTYTGPDSGFLFGLSNMIQALKSIQTDSKSCH